MRVAFAVRVPAFTGAVLFLVAAWWVMPIAAQVPAPGSPPSTAAASSSLDFEYFRTKVEPIFLNKRPERARCYVCHSQATAFRLQALPAGTASWTEAQSRMNFEAVQRLVVPGNPRASRLMRMPLVEEAGGIHFHPGGKHFNSLEDPEAQILAAWIRGAK